jgi:hypothetical protein
VPLAMVLTLQLVGQGLMLLGCTAAAALVLWCCDVTEVLPMGSDRPVTGQ